MSKGVHIAAATVPDHIARLMADPDRKELGVHLQSWYDEKADAMQERELQRVCERWLTLHGFRRRTPDEIKRPGPCAGWFIHLHDTKRNPIVLDLLILFPNGRYIEVELKSQTGKPSDEQRALIDAGWGVMCRSLVEMAERVQAGDTDAWRAPAGVCP